jgi:hypothetical protein
MGIKIEVFIAFLITALVASLYILAKGFLICDYPERSKRKNGKPTDLLSLDTEALQTGDILLLSYKGYRTFFTSIVCNSIWNHMGIVYVDPATREIFILEAANYKPPFEGDLLRMPLKDWIKINKNVHCIALLKINKPVSSALLISKYAELENLDICVQGIDLSWARFLSKKTAETVDNASFFCPKKKRATPRMARKKRQQTIPYKAKTLLARALYQSNLIQTVNQKEDYYDYMLTCTEISIYLLQEVGVFSNEHTPCSYLPSDIFKRNIPTVNGYKYLKPVEVSVFKLVNSYNSKNE